MDKVKCFQPGRFGCIDRGCPFFIFDIRFKNCAKMVDREMSIDEISFVSGMSKKRIMAILQRALKKISLNLIIEDELGKIKGRVKKLITN